MSRDRPAGMPLLPGIKKSRNFRFGSVNLYRPSVSRLSVPPMAMSAAVMSPPTMIPTMAIIVIVARVPMPIPAVAIIAMAVVAGTEAEVNRRRFDDYGRLVITIIDRRGIIDRRSWRTIGCWPADNYAR